MPKSDNAFTLQCHGVDVEVIPEVKGLTTAYKINLPLRPVTIVKKIDDCVDAWQQTDGKKSALANIIGSLIEERFM